MALRVNASILTNTPPYRLQDYTRHCPSDLVPGAFAMFDGRDWVLAKITDHQGGGQGGTPGNPGGQVPGNIQQVINELKQQIQNLNQQITTINQNVTNIQNNITQNVGVLHKIVEVQVNGDTAVVNDPFITEETLVGFIFLNGELDTHIETYVESGKVTAKFMAPEQGKLVLMLSKKA